MAFGAVSDVWFVILLTRAWTPPTPAIPVTQMPLAAALTVGAIVAVGLFAYGAALNDVLDQRHDGTFSPDRPIPAGRIRSSQAIIVAIGSLLIAILAGATLGWWGLRLTLLVSLGILFYNAVGKFIPAVGLVTIGLIHALHMAIPNVHITFTLPIWLVMTHAMAIAWGAHRLEDKRPRLNTNAAVAVIAGWIFWSAAILSWGIMRHDQWPETWDWYDLVWPVFAVAGFIVIIRWKTIMGGAIAAEKLKRYGAMWQSLYSSSWLLALGLPTQAMWIGLFALAGFAAMTLIKEVTGLMNRPLTYRG